MMKSQDILILLKLISLHQSDSVRAEDFSVRALAASTGISKTEIGASLKRSIEVGLAMLDHHSQLPTTNSKALLDFIVSGLRYVFPTKPGAIERGLITGFDAPSLEGLLSSASDYPFIWPDAQGRDKGQAVAPLYKTAPYAARQDPHLYKSMALLDAIRLGAPREINIAKKALTEHLRP